MIDIRKLREKLNLTQQGLADKCGVTLRTVQNWEKGKNIPESALRLLRTMEYESISHPTNNNNKENEEENPYYQINDRILKLVEKQHDLTERYLNALKKRDEQIDKLLSIILDKE